MTAAYKLCYLLAAYGIVVTQRQVQQIFNVTLRSLDRRKIQTGNTEISEDIEVHRQIMGTGLVEADRERLTMPEIFTYPCSPHLAAEIDHRDIDFDKIEQASQALLQSYDRVLLEGAGGLMVP